MIATVNPATGDCLATFDALTESQLEEKLARAADAFLTYRRTTFADRAGWMTRAAEILEAEKDAFARIMTLEMGKPLAAARRRPPSAPRPAGTTWSTPSACWPMSWWTPAGP